MNSYIILCYASIQTAGINFKSSNSPPLDSVLWVIIGLAAVVLLLLILILVMITVCCYRMSRTAKKKSYVFETGTCITKLYLKCSCMYN